MGEIPNNREVRLTLQATWSKRRIIRKRALAFSVCSSSVVLGLQESAVLGKTFRPFQEGTHFLLAPLPWIFPHDLIMFATIVVAEVSPVNLEALSRRVLRGKKLLDDHASLICPAIRIRRLHERLNVGFINGRIQNCAERFPREL